MKRYDPLFTQTQNKVTASSNAPAYTTVAAISRHTSPPISPMSKKPMTPSYAIIDGRRVNMYMDMENRIAYPAHVDDVF